MTRNKYQQQILFDESDLNTPEADEKPDLSQHKVFDNDDWQPLENAQGSEQDKDLILNSKPNWLWRSVLILFTVLLLIETVNFFKEGFDDSPILTAIYAALFLCVFFLAGTTALKELSGLRQFKKRQKTQKDIDDIYRGESNISAVEVCQNITDKLPCDIHAAQQQQWADIASSEHNEQELLTLYSRVVLSEVDQKAIAEISKYSSESVVLIALSPVALLDMLIMLWRNLRMIDKIAGLYGLKLGYWSRISLIKQVFVNMVYAGASELVTDFGADMLGAEVLGKLSGRLAQGLGAGLLTARLGLKTVALCRPIPFEGKPPNMADIRKEILYKLKTLAVN